MPGGKRRAKKPSDYVVAGAWPEAELEEHRGARVMQGLSRGLRDAMRRRVVSANALAQASGVNRQVIANVLHGRVWPDILTVASLEAALETRLWHAAVSPSATASTAEGQAEQVEVLLGEEVERAVIERMTGDEALTLHQHLARRDVGAARAIVDRVREPDRAVFSQMLSGPPVTFGHIAVVEQELWLTFQSLARDLAHLMAKDKQARDEAGELF